MVILAQIVLPPTEIDSFVIARANATAGSIAQYTLWRANSLPHRILGAFGLILILLATSLQGVQLMIDLFNNMK
jgi:hypothetical protein